MAVDAPPSLWPLVHRLAADEAWPPSSDAAADLFLAQCTREGLLPLFFATCAAPEWNPAPVLARALDRNRLLSRVLERRSEILQDALASVCRLLRGERFLLLKGADYGHRLYARPALRPMQDIDLLVPADRIEAVGDRLRAEGYRQDHPGGASSFAPSYPERVFHRDDVVVEIHHSFLQRARHRVDYDGVWARRVAFETDRFAAARLDDVDALVHHAIALAKDEFSVPLVRYVDLWRMLTQDAERLREAAARAVEWEAVRALYGSLRQVLRLVPELATPERESVRDALLPPATRAFLDRHVLPGETDRGKSRTDWRRRQLWRKFWLMDSARRRAAFGVEHAWATWVGSRERRRSGAAPLTDGKLEPRRS